jgi:hypothetical protein
VATFTGLEVWTDLACNGGTRTGRLPLGTLLSCVATWTTDNRDTLTFAIPFAAPDAGEVSRGRVVRVCTDDVAVFDEWRVLDIADDAQARVRSVKCDSVLQDLARAVYTAYDGTGQPTHEFSAIGVDVEGIIDGPVTDALADAGISYIAKGTVTPTGTFDVDGEYYTARSLLGQAVSAVGAEVRARRNGTTNYLLDVDTDIGSTADMVYARTARNLLATQRQRQGSLGGTRVVPRGADDSTCRGVGYAYWEVTGKSGNVLTLRDPRGAGFPSPLPFQGMAVGWYAVQRTDASVVSAISASVDAGSGEADITVADGSLFTVGDFVELMELAADDVVLVASNSAAGASVTRPASTQIGDLVVVWAYRSNSNTPPTAPGTFATVLTGGANTNSALVLSQVAASNGAATITATNATQMVVHVYRGARGIGAAQQSTGSSATLSYPGLTLQQANQSWVAAFAGHRTASNVEQPPGSLTFREDIGTGPEAASFDSNAPAASWSTTTVGVNANSGWRTATVEILPAWLPRRLWALDNPAAQAAQAGVHDRILDRPTLSGVVNYADDPFVRDFTGEARFPFVLGNGGQITASTASPVVTGSGTWFDRVVQVGDRLYTTAGPTLLGTVLTVDSATQVTLAANSLANATSADWTLGKPAPLGAASNGIAGGSMFTEQVDSNVLGVASKAWRVYDPPSSVGTADIGYRLPPMFAPVSLRTPFTYWAWVDIVELTGTLTLDCRLRQADTNAQIGAAVTLTTAEAGKQVRVLFQSPDLESFSAGVYIEVVVNFGSSSDTYDIRLGPQGAQPAGWATTDTENPRACDLWHEGTLWLATQSVPERYDLELADLATIDGARFPFEALTLGGRITIDDRDLGIRSVQRIVSLTRDYVRPGQVQLTLGRREKGLAEYLASASTATISDIALQLSRGLVAQGEAVAASPIITATPDGQTTDDGAATVSIGLNIRQAFRT